MNFTTLCQCLAPFGNSLQILCLGGKKEERAISEQKKGKTYPAGERDKDYQRLPFSRTHSRTCQAARAKYRGREEPGPGRGPPATLTQPKQATPSTTSSEKSSEAARPSGSCLGTWTVSQPKPPLVERDRAWQGEQRVRSPAASLGPEPGGQEMHAI